jgi:ferric-dicitrate binding protein FerR (iron transport regulator)
MRSDDAPEVSLNDRAAGLVELARRSLGEMTEEQRAAGLHALRTRLVNERRTRQSRWAATAIASAAACAVLGGVVWHRHARLGSAVSAPAVAAASLSVRVEGAVLDGSGSIEAGTSRPVIRFSDGSEIVLAEKARVHLRSMDDQGAHVTLDDGETHVYVVHAPSTRWIFDAGPFVVNVTGTAFGLAWREETQRLDVRLENGTVLVSGPMSDGPLSLRAGQWLTVRGSEVLIRGLSAPATSADATSTPSVEAAPAVLSGTDRPREAREGRRPGERAERRDAISREHTMDLGDSTSRHHWATDLAAGRFPSIVDEATALGIDGVLAHSELEELAALADAARYTRHESLARGALQALRRRFPRSEQAHIAAFHLGRMSESEQDPRAALSWFEAYLGEVPSGTYASEALGRKMLLVQLLDGKPAARELADTYLRRFPGGTYADAARALSSTP